METRLYYVAVIFMTLEYIHLQVANRWHKDSMVLRIPAVMPINLLRATA